MRTPTRMLSPTQEPGRASLERPLTPADTAAATALEAALRARAPALHGSTPLVRRLAAAIHRALGGDARMRGVVDLCAQVRDVGMIALPDEIVLSTGRLSSGDWALVLTHPVRSAQLLEAVHAPAAAITIVRHHHERWDGEGYPDGLCGPQIPDLSRIIAVADAFVAIAHDRPHRRGSGIDAALKEVSSEAGVQFDPEVVGALTRLVGGDAGHPRRAAELLGAGRDSDPVGRTPPRRPTRSAPATEGGSPGPPGAPSPLSSRETDVLRLLAEGLVYTQIGLELALSASTVRTHLHNIYRKLGVVDRAQAVLRAREMGWI